MRSPSRLLPPLLALAALLTLTGTAAATHNADDHSQNMKHLAAVPRSSVATQSDLAFVGNLALAGNYNGFRVIDISEPGAPVELSHPTCNGDQGDIVVWEDILVRAWNTKRANARECDGTIVPAGFEGVHIFDVSNPADPEVVGAVVLPCGSHTLTAAGISAGRLIVYSNNSSSAGCGVGLNLAQQNALGDFMDIIAVPLDDPGSAELIGTWMYCGQKAHDIAFIKGPQGKIHHFAFWLEDWNQILRAGDLFAMDGVPVDIEFAHDGTQLYLLQCRTLSHVEELQDINIPTDIPEERTIFSAQKFVRAGLVENIEYVVFIDPRDYDSVPTREKRLAVARVIGRLNERLAGRNFILIGPGRWGSNDMLLGVPVTYADISKAKMLIEVARERDGYVPEVSFGTHFFQDLVEANIAYLPLYPDDRRNRFNETFLNDSPNTLKQLLPKDADAAKVVHVIDVPAVSGGRCMASSC